MLEKSEQLPDKIRIAEAAISERVETMKRVKWDADECRAIVKPLQSFLAAVPPDRDFASG